MLSGAIGVPMGTYISSKWRPDFESCDPHICAIGLFVSAPLIYAALILSQSNEVLCFCAVFVAQLAVNVCWPLTADILLVRQIIICSKMNHLQPFTNGCRSNKQQQIT